MRKPALVIAVLAFGFVPAFSLSAADANQPSPDPSASAVTAESLTASSAAPAVTSAQPAAPSPAPATADNERNIGVGIKVGTLGIGGEVAYKIANRFNVRGGVNGFGLSHNFTGNDISFDGKLKLLSAEAHFDIFLLRSFHISPGVLLYDGNGINATASVATGTNFTVNSFTYTSASASGSCGGGGAGTCSPVGGSGNITFPKVAPEFTIGTGNLIPRGRRHWSINSEFGVAYTGAAKIGLGLTGWACTNGNTSGPTCQLASNSSGAVNTNVQAQVASWNSTLSSKFYYKLWPILSVGFSYAF